MKTIDDPGDLIAFVRGFKYQIDEGFRDSVQIAQIDSELADDLKEEATKLAGICNVSTELAEVALLTWCVEKFASLPLEEMEAQMREYRKKRTE